MKQGLTFTIRHSYLNNYHIIPYLHVIKLLQDISVKGLEVTDHRPLLHKNILCFCWHEGFYSKECLLGSVFVYHIQKKTHNLKTQTVKLLDPTNHIGQSDLDLFVVLGRVQQPGSYCNG